MPKYKVRWEHREIGVYEQIMEATGPDTACEVVDPKDAECLNFDADDCDMDVQVWDESLQTWEDGWKD